MSVSTQAGRQSSRTGVIDFGAIKQAWALFKAQSGVWVGSVGLAFVINVALWTAAAIPTGGLALIHTLYASLVTHKQIPSAPSANPYRDFLLNQIAAILTTGAGAVLTGGLYRMALQQRRGEPISVFGLFSALPQGISLFLIGIVVPVVLGVLNGVRLWPQSPFSHISDASASNLGLLLNTFVNALLMFAPFLVLDGKVNIIEAIVGGVRLLRGQLLRGIRFYIVVSFVGGIGSVLCGVGALATYPVFLISIALAYLALTPVAANAPEFDPAPAGVWPPPPRVS